MSEWEFSDVDDVTDFSSLESCDEEDLEMLLDEERVKTENYLGKVFLIS